MKVAQLNNLNKITKTVTIPILLGSMIGLPILIGGQVSWWAPFIFYLIFGVLIHGTIAHRYFSHNNFEVPLSVRKLFGILVVLGGYGSPLIWIIQHRHHHRNSDDENDTHSPKNGVWHAFIGWHIYEPHNVDQYGTTTQIKKYLRDPAVRFSTRYYFAIIWAWFLLFLLIDWKLFLAGYCVGVMLEHIRLGLINTICHIPGLPGNYKSHITNDLSQNNLFLGWLGFGFGWHNNHHKNPQKLILTERWWEIDIEGYLGWLIKQFFKIKLI